jgi:hypothetical protein
MSATCRENAVEAELLYKELLIGVTSFFRDPEVWQHLQNRRSSRAWSRAGPRAARCAPGWRHARPARRPITLAMVFAEAMPPSSATPTGIIRCRYLPPTWKKSPWPRRARASIRTIFRPTCRLNGWSGFFHRGAGRLPRQAGHTLHGRLCAAKHRQRPALCPAGRADLPQPADLPGNRAAAENPAAFPSQPQSRRRPGAGQARKP